MKKNILILLSLIWLLTLWWCAIQHNVNSDSTKNIVKPIDNFINKYWNLNDKKKLKQIQEKNKKWYTEIDKDQ